MSDTFGSGFMVKGAFKSLELSVNFIDFWRDLAKQASLMAFAASKVESLEAVCKI